MFFLINSRTKLLFNNKKEKIPNEGLDFAVPVFLSAYAGRFGAKIRPLQLQRLAASVPDGARRCPPRGRFGFNEPHTAKTKRQAMPVFLFWRRRRDLNPRASCPTYTLSRGASSPLEYISVLYACVNNKLAIILYQFILPLSSLFVKNFSTKSDENPLKAIKQLVKKIKRPIFYFYFDNFS